MPSRLKCETTEQLLTIHFTEAKILDEQGIEQIFRDVVSLLEKTEQRNVLLDFRMVEFMSSATLGMLIRVHKKCREFKITLKFCNISSEIFEIFDITGLDKVFSIHNTTEDAHEAFEKEGASQE